MSRWEQNSDGSGRGGCLKLDIGIAFDEMFKSLDSDRPRERGAKTSFSSSHPAMAAVEATGRLKYKKDMDEKSKEYLRAGIATNIIVRSRRTEGSAERKTIRGLAEPFQGQCGEKMIGSVTKNAELRVSRQGGRKTSLHGFY